MRNISAAFRDAIQSFGKELACEITCGEDTYSAEQIVSVNLHYDGALLSSVMQCMDVELDNVGTESFAAEIVGKFLTVRFGIRQGGDSEYEYVDFGSFIVKASVYNADTNSVSLECYDNLLLSMVPYTPVVNFSDDSEITVREYLSALAARLELHLGTENFTNADVLIDDEKYDSTYTIRDVLDEIAQVAAGIIAVIDGDLCVVYPAETGEIVDPSNLSTLTVGKQYGPVNSVVLGRTPQEDNIYRRDEAATEWIEYRIDNNQIMDSHREDFIDGIYDRLSGLSFYMFSATSYGDFRFTLCDRFTLQDLDGSEYSTILLSSDLQIDQGISETLVAEAPAGSETEYKAASKSDRVMNQTILRVDKQEQQIQALVTTTKQTEDRLTGEVESIRKSVEATMTSEQVSILIKQEIGDINSVTTATGYTFDEEGLEISEEGKEIRTKVTPSGFYVQKNDDPLLTADSEGVNAANVNVRQYLVVGKNSRFEDYAGNRTACFYIGE